MKKAKVMLLTIAVFASVGAALAFKVKKIGSTSYCYLQAQTQPADGACINGISSATATPLTTGTKIYYTITDNAANCDEAPTLECSSTAQLPFGG